MNNIDGIPILSICIPTFNRAALLNKLLNQIYTLDNETKLKFDICISDNCSTDTTPEVISEWQTKLDIVAVRQDLNIGGSRNFQAVSALARTPWILLMGDDDLLDITGFTAMLNVLNTVSSNTWILADIRNQDRSSLLEKFHGGQWTTSEFKRAILFTSILDSLGFLSMHVIPRLSVQKFLTLSVDKIYGWPHLALLISEIHSIEIYIHKECIVRRGGDGDQITQTWRSNDWLCLMMQKTKLCCFSDSGNNYFATAVALREYLGWSYARQTLYTSLVLDQRKALFAQAARYLDQTAILSVIRNLLKFYIWLLLLVPTRIIFFARRLRNSNAIALNEIDRSNQQTDGIDRGL